ncbi:hypothetical protein PAALTS15_19153 [Paenibacillus alvei TS-15]|uniref:DUF4901 domain-containing protein n=1 Tax=Paenibacillus alvei TS-15 TaxID=1117108 RepID=S9SIQ3_PAEAL|nr:hypothetical protein [Paenibacillus alvei]EPY05677.1 hypothetical protein PAALTS15_19153 [Paenibacillus alvei TS-15]
MTIHIQEIIHATQHKFGLEDYRLHTQELYREVNLFNETTYYLSMEWYPPYVKESVDEDSNPEGTAVISYDLTTGQYTSVIFVQGKSYANSPSYPNIGLEEIIAWIERDTELVYGKQFQLSRHQNGQYVFHECVSGTPVSPGGHIEIHFDEAGKLVQYSNYGFYASKSLIQKEAFTLSLEQVEPLAMQQLKLLEYPVYEEQRLLPLYGIEEVYVTNDGASVIPFEFIIHSGSRLIIDKVIEWEQVNTQPLEKVDIEWRETVTAEQVVSSEPHPDSFSITGAEQEKAVAAVVEGMSQLYPNDSGQWVLKTLHRHRGYIEAILREQTPSKRVFQRKLVLFIDAQRFVTVNAMDNLPFIEMFDDFQAADEVVISQDEAYVKLKKKGFIELTPVYVYHPEQKKYILCGKLDCAYAVNAANGEIMELNNI